MDVLNAVSGFLQGFWSEINGRIFLTTLIAYAASYMVYSGYISWFAGGYGGLLLTQVGFSIIDLLGLIPMVFVLLIESLWSLLKAAAKYILLYFVIPFALLAILSTAIQSLGIRVFPGNVTVEITGLLTWVGGVCTGFPAPQLKEHKWLSRLPLIACYAGMTLAALATPFASSASIHPLLPQWISDLMFNISAAALLIMSCTFPFLAGMNIGKLAVRRKLLSCVQKMVLSQPIEMTGALPVKGPKKKKAQGDANDKSLTYTWEKDRPAYLVASLSRTTVLYLPPETTLEESGQMVLLANDLIYAMEVGKKKPVSRPLTIL